MVPDALVPISLHSYSEAAAALGVEESWLRRHIKKLPHSKLGGRVRFTDSDLQRIIDLFHREPSTAQSATPCSGGAHPLGTLRPLPRSAKRRAL
nr:helix-turn-helix domain-containing protein [Streptomyces sp. NBC_00830]